METRVMPVAQWFDRRARQYHDAGIPLLHALFEPMSNAPAAGARAGIAIPSNYFAPVTATIRRDVLAACNADGFAGAARALDLELALLDRLPAIDCMVRHILQSARRLVALAPVHAEQARAKGLPSPDWISMLLLRLHLWALGPAASLDADALALQVTGVPILACDLPVITA
jgi:hypothetical protein